MNKDLYSLKTLSLLSIHSCPSYLSAVCVRRLAHSIAPCLRISCVPTRLKMQDEDSLLHTPMRTLDQLYSELLALIEGNGGRFVIPTRLDNSAYVHPETEHSLNLLRGVASCGH